MKKIIAGMRFDTEISTKIASYSNGLSYSDFYHLEESLFKMKSGNFFLAGGGGSLTKYAVSHRPGETSGSTGITPLSEGEAFSWLEEHNCI